MERKVKWTPLILQMEALECGAASLSMIMAYYKKWVPIEEVRIACGVSRSGSKASNILKAARYYGLEAHGYKLSYEELKEMNNFPAIIHWNDNHFVVLCGFFGGKALINDPDEGKVRISIKEFIQSYSGVCLTFSPSKDFIEQPRRKTSVIRYVFENTKNAKGALIFFVAISVITTLFSLLSPKLDEYFYDKILDGDKAFLPFFLVFLAYLLIESSFLLFTSIQTFKINGRLDVSGSTKYVRKILKLPMSFFEQHSTGDLLVRKEATSGLAETIVTNLGPTFINAVLMIVIFIIMVTYNSKLALIALASFIFSVAVMIISLGPKVGIARLERRSRGSLYSKTFTGFEIFETIKALGCEESYYQMWSKSQKSFIKDKKKDILINIFLDALPMLVTNLSNALVTIVGILLIIRGQFSLGMLTAFQGYVSSFLEPADMIVSAGNEINTSIADKERIEDVLGSKDDELLENTKLPEAEDYKLGGHIILKDITFGYGILEPPVLENISVDIKPGSKVAFVGGSGSGKSTISKLICGLYAPWSGTITYDGKTIDQIPRSLFTGSIAVVDQDISLFNDTIANNIKMWDPAIEDFEMILAAKDAQIHERIKLEGGYDREVASSGKNLSGGERQRIEIARVLAQDPSIIILDEATSALDAKTENDVIEAITARGITCIIIAHRLSTIRDCDCINVLDHGHIVQSGTHKQLIKQEGLYKQLVLDE